MSGKNLLPLSGVVAVLLIVAAFIVGGETPATDDSLEEVVSYYTDNDTEIAISSLLAGLGAFFFLLFTAAVAGRLRGPAGESTPSSTVCLAGGIVLVVGMTIFAGLGFAAADVVDDVEPSVVQAINALGSDMFFTVAVGTAAFLVGAGFGSRRTDALPSWLSWSAIVLGVVAITPLGFFAFLALGVWALIVSVLLFWRADGERQARRQPAA
jgi:hypothetical protein